MGHQPRRFGAIGHAGATAGQMIAGRGQCHSLAGKAAAAFPGDDVDVHVGDGQAVLPRMATRPQGRQAGKAARCKVAGDGGIDTIPGRHHDAMEARPEGMGKQGMSLAETVREIAGAPVVDEFALAPLWTGPVGVGIAVLEHAGPGIGAQKGCAGFLQPGGHDRQGQGHAETAPQVEQAGKPAVVGPRVVVAPPEGCCAAGLSPEVQLALQVVPVSHGRPTRQAGARWSAHPKDRSRRQGVGAARARGRPQPPGLPGRDGPRRRPRQGRARP